MMLHKNQYKVLFSQVQDAFRCRLRNCQDPINADSSSSFPNGHAQIMVSFFFFSLTRNLVFLSKGKHLQYCMWQVCTAEIWTPFLSVSLLRSLSACLNLWASFKLLVWSFSRAQWISIFHQRSLWQKILT